MGKTSRVNISGDPFVGGRHRSKRWYFSVLNALLWQALPFAESDRLALIRPYGIVFYGVVQRMRELGVRLALGTTPADLRRMLLQQGMLPIITGGPGIGATVPAGRFLTSAIEGANSQDLLAASTAVLLIVLISAGSIWIETLRVPSIDVMAILRSD